MKGRKTRVFPDAVRTIHVPLMLYLRIEVAKPVYLCNYVKSECTFKLACINGRQYSGGKFQPKARVVILSQKGVVKMDSVTLI